MKHAKISFDDSAFPIVCPACKKKIEQTIGWLKQDGQRCPHCGLGFETKQFQEGIERAERAFEDLRKAFPKH